MSAAVPMNILFTVHISETFHLISTEWVDLYLPIITFIQSGVKLQLKRLFRVHEENVEYITEICTLVVICIRLHTKTVTIGACATLYIILYSEACNFLYLRL